MKKAKETKKPKKILTKDQMNRRVVAKKLFCVVFLVISILLSTTMLAMAEGNLLEIAFSVIGDANQAMFIMWGVATAGAVYLNMKLLASRLQVKSKIFEVVLAVACLAAIPLVCITGYETWRRIVHVTSAMLFGILGIICVVFLFIMKLRRKSKKSAVPWLMAIFIVAVMFIYSTVQVGWFTAFTQILVINLCLIATFTSNFFEKWPEAPSATNNMEMMLEEMDASIDNLNIENPEEN